MLSFSEVCIYSQGPAGTRGPEGRQGEKGTKVTPACIHTHVHTQMYFLTYIRVYKQVVFIIFYREPQVLLAPQVKQALWVPRECQENLEQKVLEGSQDQWLVNSPTSPCLRPNVPEGQLLPSLFLFQGEQGSPGPSGQKGPPGPIVSWQCLHVSIYEFHLSTLSSPPPPPH